jgi:hypothetical protein
MNSFQKSRKETLKEQIDKLDSTEHVQIYQIIKMHTSAITKVSNGILVSTDSLNNDCLQEIENYVFFCMDQRKRMDDDSKTRKGYERMVSN